MYMYHAGTFYIIICLKLVIAYVHILFNSIIHERTCMYQTLQVHIHITTYLVLGGSTMNARSFP